MVQCSNEHILLTFASTGAKIVFKDARQASLAIQKHLKIDPLLSLAVSMHEQNGVYALLLGSGVSRSAKIPTGWEIVLDLASKLAKVSGEQVEREEAAGWYKAKYGEELNYSRLLDELTASSAERQQLLKEYFEPTRTKPRKASNHRRQRIRRSQNWSLADTCGLF